GNGNGTADGNGNGRGRGDRGGGDGGAGDGGGDRTASPAGPAGVRPGSATGDVAGLAVREPVIPALFVRADVAVPSTEAAGLARRIALYDQSIMVALLVAVLLAGMKAFYIDHTFGGMWDAALAVSWGLAGGIVSGPLSTALGRAAESVRSVLGR
nr:hypothetical protein [Micromonospora sp. DSM 115978]